MNVDAITLAAVADEWRALLTGARIDTIIAPTSTAIAIQCYAPGMPAGRAQSGSNRWLYLSAHPMMARAHLTAQKPARIASEPSAFVMLLRKYLEGARIESIVQPRWERVIELVASHRAGPETEERARYRLIVEVMGRLSNIICCDQQGRILGSLKVVGAEVNRYRVITPNVPYVPPPPQQRILAGQSLPRLDPAIDTAGALQQAAAGEAVALVQAQAASSTQPSRKARKPQQPLLWQLLTRHLLGFSQLLSREAVYRTTGDVDAPLTQDVDTWEELAWNVRDLAALLDRHTWRPQLIERAASAEASPMLLAFAPYVLEQYAEMPDTHARPMPSINAAIDEYYAGAEWRDAMESIRAPLRRVLQAQLERCLRKAEALQQQLAASEEASTYRLWAELLLAHQHEIRQGQTSAILENYFSSDEEGLSPVTVPLDPRFDAVGNANRLFHKYHKLRRALELVPTQIEQNSAEMATVEQLLADLALAETPAEAALVRAEVQEAGYLRASQERQPQQKGSKRKGGKGGKHGKDKKGVPPGGGVPLHVQSRDGFTILIGKNSRQNEEVTFRQAAANDLWLHARGVPGAHVIIKAGGREIPRATIAQAASLAAYYSQARGSTSVPVDYTLQRYVRHMKGGGPGMVVYERERTIYAEPSVSDLSS
jgi:predicted ribosome quality control (RQC) complex YloA/Tae2 family protein